MALRKQNMFDEILDLLEVEILGMLHIAIVNSKTGKIEAVRSYSSNMAADVFAQNDSRILLEIKKVFNTLHLRNEGIEEVISKAGQHIHFIHLIQGGKYFLSIIADADMANLALTRDVLRKCS